MCSLTAPPILFPQKSNCFCSMSQEITKDTFRGKVIFPHNFHMDTLNAAFTTTPKSFSPSVKKFLFGFPERDFSVNYFLKNLFSSKNSCGHVECNFDNRAKKVSKKRQKLFCSILKTRTFCHFLEF